MKRTTILSLPLFLLALGLEQARATEWTSKPNPIGPKFVDHIKKDKTPAQPSKKGKKKDPNPKNDH